VSGITSYGAFVDIGGADGLIHISELSWDRVSKVTDVLQLGEEVTVKVIKLDPEQTRISLSLRQLQQDPWEKLVQSMRSARWWKARSRRQEVRRFPSDHAGHRRPASHLRTLLGPRRADRGRAPRSARRCR